MKICSMRVAVFHQSVADDPCTTPFAMYTYLLSLPLYRRPVLVTDSSVFRCRRSYVVYVIHTTGIDKARFMFGNYIHMFKKLHTWWNLHPKLNHPLQLAAPRVFHALPHV